MRRILEPKREFYGEKIKRNYSQKEPKEYDQTNFKQAH